MSKISVLHKSHALRAVSLLVLMSGVTSCHYNGDVTVGCSKVGRLETPMGFVNSPGLPVGNIESLDVSQDGTKTMTFVRKATFDPAEVKITPDTDHTDISNTSELDVSVNASVSASKLQAINAAAKSQVSSNIQLTLENSQRHQFDDPAAILNQDATKTDLISRIKSNPGTTYIFVYGGTSATGVKFSLKNGTQNSLSFSFGSDSFSGSVNYSCQGDLNETVSADNEKTVIVFFKAVKVVMAPDGQSLTTQAITENIGDYNWTHAIM